MPMTQTDADFRPASLYSPVEGFGTDFTTDSTQSPETPMSAPFASAYTLPQDVGDWSTWDSNVEFSPKASFLKPETFDESPSLASIPSYGEPLSPLVDLMDLTNSGVDDVVVFGREGINDTQPLFQPLPSRPQPTKPARATSKPALFVKTRPTSPNQLTHGAPPAQDERAAKRYPSRNRKRKSPASTTPSASSSPTSSDDDLSPPPRSRRISGEPSAAVSAPKKTAHNMIEKRYRNNLNDKIAALRDAVPTLRAAAKRAEGQTSCSEDEDEGEDPSTGGQGRGGKLTSRRGIRVGGSSKGADPAGGIAPAHKLNKATILSKATEYIVYLERLNQSMSEENDALRASIGGLEMLVMGRGGSGMWN